MENENQQVSLKEFLNDGCLGGLKPGLSQERVIQTLGPPSTLGGYSRKHRYPSILKYGNVEFHLSRSSPFVCETIYIETSTMETSMSLPACLRIVEWNLSPHAGRAEVEHYLHINEIDFVVTSPSNSDALTFAIPRSGASINLDENDVLWSLSVSRSA